MGNGGCVMGCRTLVERRGIRRRLAVALTGLAVLLAAGSAAAQERAALVIGNGAYEHQGRLPNPPNDAADMGAALDRLGFQVTSVIDADVDTMLDALDAFESSGRERGRCPGVLCGAWHRGGGQELSDSRGCRACAPGPRGPRGDLAGPAAGKDRGGAAAAGDSGCMPEQPVRGADGADAGGGVAGGGVAGAGGGGAAGQRLRGSAGGPVHGAGQGGRGRRGGRTVRSRRRCWSTSRRPA